MIDMQSKYFSGITSNSLKGTSFAPVRMLGLELAAPLPVLSAIDPHTDRCYHHARALVRLHTQPLGLVDLELNESRLAPDHYASQIWASLGEAINAHLRADGLAEIEGLKPEGLLDREAPACLRVREAFLARAPFVSVVVCTRDRVEQLTNCLASLLALEYPYYEIIVVDNAPATSATYDLMRNQYGHLKQVRYVREDRPGLSWARNRGLIESAAEIVAYTDDDVVVDRFWLAELAKGFGLAENVACVSGLIVPARLDNSAEQWFEQINSSTHGFSRLIHNITSRRMDHPFYPYNAIKYGAGNNMAYRSAVLRKLGGFYTAVQGGEDIEMYFRANTRGYTLVYEPGAIVHHHNRSDHVALRRQLHAYGSAFVVFLVRSMLVDPSQTLSLIGKLPKVFHALRLFRFGRSLESPNNYCPEDIARVRWAGMLASPIWYFRQRWQSYLTIKRFGPLPVNVM